MRLSCTGMILSLLVHFVLPAAAQSGSPPHPTNSAVRLDTLTGKERLGKKWMDEQRIDNCHVPPDKRGTRPRSNACPNTPSG